MRDLAPTFKLLDCNGYTRPRRSKKYWRWVDEVAHAKRAPPNNEVATLSVA